MFLQENLNFLDCLCNIWCVSVSQCVCLLYSPLYTVHLVVQFPSRFCPKSQDLPLLRLQLEVLGQIHVEILEFLWDVSSLVILS